MIRRPALVYRLQSRNVRFQNQATRAVVDRAILQCRKLTSVSSSHSSDALFINDLYSKRSNIKRCLRFHYFLFPEENRQGPSKAKRED